MSLIKKIAGFRPVRAFLRSQRGIAATEFALTLPIWVILTLGCVDGAFCLLINERVDRIAYSVADIVTQQQSVTKADLDNTFLAAGELMKPFPFGAQGLVIVSSIYKAAGQGAIIKWQYSGGGTLSRASKIGTTGGAPSLPTGLTLNDNDNLIVSEAFYTFTPMFASSGLFSASDIYRIAIYKPRLSLLTTPPT